MYEKEAIQIEAKNEKLKNEGADEYVLRKQVNFKARNWCFCLMLSCVMPYQIISAKLSPTWDHPV